MDNPPPGKLQHYLSNLRTDIVRACESLAAMRLLWAAHSACPICFEDYPFAMTNLSNASDCLLMSIARIFDGHRDSVSLVQVCRYIENHAGEFVWLNSEQGRKHYLDGAAEARRRAQKWEAWASEHALRNRVQVIRDGLLAHRDKDLATGEIEVPIMSHNEVDTFLDDVTTAINDLLYLDGAQTFVKPAYERVINSGRTALACEEVTRARLRDPGPDRDELHTQIQAVRDSIDAAMRELGEDQA